MEPLRPLRKREFPIHFAEGKRLLHVVVHMSDAPGSLSAILDVLGSRVNLVGLTSYTLSDGTAMLSAFAEALPPGEPVSVTAQALKKLDAALEVRVTEGTDGILVDDFHTGMQVGDDDYIMLSREGLSRVFDHIVRIFGTGGEVLLYEEGKALGQQNSQRMLGALGSERVESAASYLLRSLTAEGWGTVQSSKPGVRPFKVTIEDCFECKGGSNVRKGCDLARGFYEGSVEATRGVPAKVEEVECTLRGGKACVFHVSTA